MSLRRHQHDSRESADPHPPPRAEAPRSARFSGESVRRVSAAQVSVAVLLDNFVTASDLMNTQERDRKLHERKSLSLFKNPLEPLILRLASRHAAIVPRYTCLSAARAELPSPPAAAAMLVVLGCFPGKDSTLAPARPGTLVIHY